ncbi:MULTISPECIES: hypothetical protein [unclassified Caldicellulosiruptor]|uniref:hypothetical protein n=1 Tax=unclassified Caldicellulosiruptor TaxID=2622462 RepID=UPI00039EA8C5|nr:MULTISPECIES: hypothetical protein [unclassified Caldicellulosiruptor]
MEAELNKGYTYRDYVSLNDRKRYELINGELYLLASPSEIHQRTNLEFPSSIGFLITIKAA